MGAGENEGMGELEVDECRTGMKDDNGQRD